MAFRVNNVMDPQLSTAAQSDPIESTAAKMLREGLEAIAAVDESSRFVGVIRLCDVIEAMSDPDADAIHVADLMHRDYPVLSPQDSVWDVTDVCRNRDVTWLPVVAAGRLVGSLTLLNLLRYLRSIRQRLRYGRDGRLIRFDSQQGIADFCSVSVDTIRRRMKAGKIPRRREGGQYVFNIHELSLVLDR